VRDNEQANLKLETLNRVGAFTIVRTRRLDNGIFTGCMASGPRDQETELAFTRARTEGFDVALARTRGFGQIDGKAQLRLVLSNGGVIAATPTRPNIQSLNADLGPSSQSVIDRSAGVSELAVQLPGEMLRYQVPNLQQSLRALDNCALRTCEEIDEKGDAVRGELVTVFAKAGLTANSVRMQPKNANPSFARFLEFWATERVQGGIRLFEGNPSLQSALAETFDPAGCRVISDAERSAGSDRPIREISYDCQRRDMRAYTRVSGIKERGVIVLLHFTPWAHRQQLDTLHNRIFAALVESVGTK